MIYNSFNMITYVLLIIGMISFFFDKNIEGIRIFIKKKKRLGEYMYESERDIKKIQGYKKEIAMLLSATTGNDSVKSVNIFIYSSVALGIATFYIYSFIHSLFLGIIIAIFISCTPYVFLRMKLQLLRINSSKEGDLVVSQVLNFYKINHYNMKEAIEKAALELEGAPNSKLILMNLAKELNNTKDQSDIEEHLEKFKYAFGTIWANVLSNNIYFAEVLGLKVTTSLVDLLNLIKNSRKVMEFEKRENNEGNIILKFLAPLIYILSIFVACYFFDFTIIKFINYQFFTSTGLFWFFIVCITFFIGYIGIFAISKRKMDI